MNSNLRIISGSLILGTVLTFSLYGIAKNLTMADDDHFDDDSHRQKYAISYSAGQFPDLNNPLYTEECGSCHMAYPPQLLPPASWHKIMENLNDHFGENAELDADTRSRIENYLAETSGKRPYRKILRNLGNATPTRITELPYFIHEHDEIPARLIGDNENIASISQCNACHRGAEQGQFDEDDVFIRGFGRWDD